MSRRWRAAALLCVLGALAPGVDAAASGDHAASPARSIAARAALRATDLDSLGPHPRIAAQHYTTAPNGATRLQRDFSFTTGGPLVLLDDTVQVTPTGQDAHGAFLSLYHEFASPASAIRLFAMAITGRYQPVSRAGQPAWQIRGSTRAPIGDEAFDQAATVTTRTGELVLTAVSVRVGRAIQTVVTATPELEQTQTTAWAFAQLLQHHIRTALRQS